ncbi:hypothetical protein [Aeromicrobium fastidiosum]|uniref:Uncharacterized protein n=1 Tax=Aeromicrobium fastidiosum TaxID=52699 RepID=A0A641AMW7_9ACTN|nr:hypothetical protein [Aeromicrobium fastidiosum]KAA1376264.1 hypothetical protein ESP62_012565 [Aeromicrobium fastidiosum]MBP2391841.1 uncharacterized membrane protein YozB (DUF420 family) [Aeromicrobium fastidiosum]
MSLPRRVVVAVILVAIAVCGLVVVASQIAVTYYLPPGESGVATKHVSAFKPAIAGTVIASLAAIALLAHLVVVLRGRTARWMWFVATACALVSVGTPIIVATMDRPVY